jgi:hypothetical protein
MLKNPSIYKFQKGLLYCTVRIELLSYLGNTEAVNYWMVSQWWYDPRVPPVPA